MLIFSLQFSICMHKLSKCTCVQIAHLNAQECGDLLHGVAEYGTDAHCAQLGKLQRLQR